MIVNPGSPNREDTRPPAGLTRRRFLHGATGTATGVTAAAILGTPTLAWADEAEFARLRQWWVDFLTGGEQDLADPDVRAAIDGMDNSVDSSLELVDPDPNRTAVFTDYPWDPNSVNRMRHTAFSAARLRTMGTAWATNGSRHYQDEALLATVAAGAHTILTHNYIAGVPEGDAGWYNFEIAMPQYLNGVFAILGDAADPDDLAAYAAAVDFYVSDPRYNYLPDNPKHKLSTGANRVDLCEAVIVRGINARTPERIADAVDALGDVMVYTDKGDGFHRDGGFIQHNAIAYTGTYGAGLLRDLSVLLAMLSGSTWEVTGSGVEVIFDSVENCYAPMIYDAQTFSHVCGRAVGRKNRVEYGTSFDIVQGILTIAAAAPAERAKAWRERCLGWFNRGTFADPLATTSLYRLGLFKSILNDSNLTPAREPIEHRVFPSVARAVHRRKKWAFTISMCRKDIAAYEGYSRGENKHGWYQGRGMNYLYLTGDNAQFSDVFWPTIDPMRLPGVTVERRELPDTGERGTTASFAGGVSIDGSAVIGQKIVGPGEGSAMRGNKSWFCLEDEIVAVGSRIVGDGSYPIETIMENRNLFETGTNPLTVDGVRQPGDQGWTANLGRPGWAHLDSVAGYVLLDSLAGSDPDLIALRDERTATWLDIDHYWSTNDDTPHTRRYLTMYLDHGADPGNGSYAYMIVPGASAAETEQRHAEPGVQLLAQTSYTHALYHPGTGFTGINFFGIPTPAEKVTLAGDLDGVTVRASKLCTVALSSQDDKLQVGVANPAHNVDTVIIELTGLNYRLESADPTVEVSVTDSKITITNDTSDRDGRTHRALLIKEG